MNFDPVPKIWVFTMSCGMIITIPIFSAVCRQILFSKFIILPLSSLTMLWTRKCSIQSTIIFLSTNYNKNATWIWVWTAFAYNCLTSNRTLMEQKLNRKLLWLKFCLNWTFFLYENVIEVIEPFLTGWNCYLVWNVRRFSEMKWVPGLWSTALHSKTKSSTTLNPHWLYFQYSPLS